MPGKIKILFIMMTVSTFARAASPTPTPEQGPVTPPSASPAPAASATPTPAATPKERATPTPVAASATPSAAPTATPINKVVEPKAALISKEAPRIKGIWKSLNPEKTPKGIYLTREFQFTLSRWEETIFFSQTADMKKVILIYRAEGPYELKNAATETAWALNMRVSRRALNLQNSVPSALKEIGANGCPMTKKSETSIAAGCGIFPAVSKCPIEYELVETKNNQLFLGNHEVADFPCAETKRPTSVGLPLKHIN